MTDRHKRIIEQLKLDNIEIEFVDNLLTPGRYIIEDKSGIIKYRIKLDNTILNGTNPDYPPKRIELVLYHEWGHIKDCRKDPVKFSGLNSINECHADLEYEAFHYALQVAFNEAKAGDISLLEEALLRYNQRFSSESNPEYVKALSKIFLSVLWKESQTLVLKK